MLQRLKQIFRNSFTFHNQWTSVWLKQIIWFNINFSTESHRSVINLKIISFELYLCGFGIIIDIFI